MLLYLRQKGSILVSLLFLIVLTIDGVYLYRNNYFSKTKYGILDEPEAITLQIPENLSIPFKIDKKRGVVNPFGVVRTSKDRKEIGHPGIDFPLIANRQFLQ